MPGAPPGFTLDPLPWVEGTVLEDYYLGEDEVGFFHVTTRIDAVEREGRLRARKELSRVIGLGSYSAEGIDRISFVFRLSDARRLHHAIETAALAARDLLPASEILRRVLDWTDFPGARGYQDYFEDQVDDDGNLDQDIQDDLDEFARLVGIELPKGLDSSSLAEQYTWDRLIKKQKRRIDSAYGRSSGGPKYYLIQMIEEFVVRFIENDYWDGGVCLPLVGFTAPWERFRKTVPDQVSIIQAAVRVGAPEETVIDECELRFLPEDVRLVQTRVEDRGPVPVPVAQKSA